MDKKALTFLLFIFTVVRLMATHQRAAEITYRHLGSNSYEFTLTCYTYTQSVAGLQRDSLLMVWGDGSESYIPRLVYQNLGNDYTLNVYKTIHNYSSAGTYHISMEDANRNYGVVNVPNSVSIPMFVETELVINPFMGYNSSVQLTAAPIDQGCVGKLFLHNPVAYDPDGDSLSFRLVPCRGFEGENIPGYDYPMTSNTFTIDPVTGELQWDSPVLQGEYNVAFVVEEWRNGVKIGSVTRDMQILISSCNNNLPIIEGPDDICVIAGEQVVFSVSASDPDYNQVTLTAAGTPFELPVSPAEVVPETVTGSNPTMQFVWNTECHHVRQTPYQVVFHAKDNATPVSLVNLKNVNIRVIGPKPEGLTAEMEANAVHLEWQTYNCQNAEKLRLYRKIGSNDYVPDSCETGIRPGYVMIAELADVTTTQYDDQLPPQGTEYCYRLLAVYHDGAESIVSDEVCVYSPNSDKPLITHVSNDSTNLSIGRVIVAWTAPKEMEEPLPPQPFRYALTRIGNGGETVIYEGNDTVYIDNAVDINASTNFAYKVKISDATGTEIGTSVVAHPIELTAQTAPNAILLNWNENVPWSVDSTSIYRKVGGEYHKIVSTTSFSYTDNIYNCDTYEYYVVTYGHYSISGVVRPIVNYSAIVEANSCQLPDPPVLEVETDCGELREGGDGSVMPSNILTWTMKSLDNVAGYEIYWHSYLGGADSLIAQINNPNTSTWTHSNLRRVAGCYSIVVVDEEGRHSQPSNTVCVACDACPLYGLPNVFTPNEDGINEVFEPFPKYLPTIEDQIISEFKIVVFNRWGNVVYDTTDPYVQWDGKSQQTKLKCSPATYFYVAEIKYLTPDCGEWSQRLQGSVSIVR